MPGIISINELMYGSSAEHFKIHRDILSWSTKQQYREFDVTEIGHWLLEHHQPFRDEFANSHIPSSYRLHSKRTYITSRLDELAQLRVLQKTRTVKSAKNDTEKTLYAFTREGSFIAWLVEAYYTKEDKVRRSEATAAVFDILGSYLRNDGSSFAQFVTVFIDKLRQENMLHILIEHSTYNLARLVLQQDLRLAREVFPAIAHVGIVPTRIFKEAFKELSETTKRLLLFQFKMDIESNYGSWELTKEWEEMRYKYRNDLS
jgi:hypothetical protein